MKLSARLPPAPPPEESSETGPSSPETMAAPPANAAAPMEPKSLAWPAWFPGADLLLAALAIVFAFMIASFAARNSDLWLHLAAGKRLISGEYTPGTDPFSYSGENRTWVNHSLLFDAAAFLLYRNDGQLLVIVKALAVALAFGLVIGIRRPGFALWPWAAVAIVAVLAAGPRLILSPLIGSLLFLAVTLFLLFRIQHRPGSWRFPIAIGITFWLWANTDAWFILGPIAVGLVLLGELLQQKLWPQSEPAPGGAPEPLGPLPDVPALAKALGIGLLACMLNPHHIRVWELPFEMIGDDVVKADYRLRQVLYSPLDSDFIADTPRGRSLGYNINGLSYALLFVCGGVLLGIGASRVRIAHLALWIGFALISLTSIYAIPLFALVAVPIVASQLNGLSSRAQLRSWGDPKSRFLLLGSAAGRVGCILAAAVACALAWPGWLHPETGNPAFTRRVAWSVEPDQGLARAAKQIQAWRETGQLPPSARGMVASPDMANYCAWFAPSEKVYANSRFNFHRPELPRFVSIRKGLQPVEVSDSNAIDEQQLRRMAEALVKDLDEDLRSLGVEYVVLSGGPGEGSQRLVAQQTSIRLWRDTQRWSVWYLDGRSTVCGWRSPGEEKPTFTGLRLDPVALAFGKSVEPVPQGTTRAVPVQSGWEDAYVRSPKVSPAAADEAMGWVRYAQVRQIARLERQMAIELSIYFTDRVVGQRGLLAMRFRLPPDEDDVAIAFLAFRAARRAIDSDPDHPDGYYALAAALRDENLPIAPDDRVLGRITALRQYLIRMPPPDRYQRGIYLWAPSQAATELAYLYLNPSSSGLFWGVRLGQPAFQILAATGPGSPALYGATGYMAEVGRQVFRLQPGDGQQMPPNGRIVESTPYLLALDVARETIALAEKYALVDFADPEDAKKNVEEIRQRLKSVDIHLGNKTNAFEREKLRHGSNRVSVQLSEALRFNLVGEALRLLTDPELDLTKEFGRNVLEVALFRVALELAVGRLEDAARDLDELSSQINELSAVPESRRDPKVTLLLTVLNRLLYQKMLLEGNFREAGVLLEKSMPPTVGVDLPLSPEAAALKPATFVQRPPALQAFLELAPLAVPQLDGHGRLAVVGQLLLIGSLADQSTVVRLLLSLADLAEPILDGWARFGVIGRLVITETFDATQQELNARRNRDADFFWKRGLLFLLEGNMNEAKKRLEKSFQQGRPEWGVPDRQHAEAIRFLQLIDRASRTEK